MRKNAGIAALFVISILAALALGFFGAGALVDLRDRDNMQEESVAAISADPKISESLQPSAEAATTAVPEPTPESTPEPTPLPLAGITIGIDAGHQAQGNLNMEAVAPGSSEMKYKVSSGTQGRFTGVPEHEVVLEVALLLQEKLEALGAETVMVRTTKDVDISNVERATIMNEAGVHLCIRIHADGSENPSVSGASMLLPANDCTEAIREQSAEAGRIILDEFIAATGAKNLGLIDRKDLSGFNWSTVPVILIELGFMTNEAEDKLLVTKEYQEKCAEGIKNGVLIYFAD